MSAAELNARIRELWADGRLPEERRGEYEALVLKWAAAALERGGDATSVERAA
ncbi:hypothetical protein GCM10010387_56830 [Streptomyces inusitatus]|uniref:Uncharacterized protein n=1 Tax=Streptomyces inusitatus TaxID=68221 RepID=A0A918QMD2_9ACTN|nr:hypothetical protein [Streptomyces inusitatus]GGZ55355.1 hypothetical protein GCM10010387_56830 [Streptomyces inusitatus]